MCADAGGENGSIILWECHYGGGNQNFVLSAQGLLKMYDGSRCVRVDREGSLYLSFCDETDPSQIWAFVP